MVSIESTWTAVPGGAFTSFTFVCGALCGAAVTYAPLTLRLWALRKRLDRMQQK
jgi:hypothetical protein